jgi:hypothetical protein
MFFKISSNSLVFFPVITFKYSYNLSILSLIHLNLFSFVITAQFSVSLTQAFWFICNFSSSVVDDFQGLC